MRRAQKWADWGPTITRPPRSLVPSGLKPPHSAYCSRCPYSNGHPQRVVGVNIDVTERKQAEQILAERDVQLDLAARIGRIGTFTIDYTTGIIQLSPGYANVYGLAE